MKYTSEIMATRKDGTVQREVITFAGRNGAGEEVCLDLSVVAPLLQWKAKGNVPKTMEHYWSVMVYATDAKGNCFGKYNPQHKADKNAPAGCTMNFAWVLDCTAENREKIIDEVYRRAGFEEV